MRLVGVSIAALLMSGCSYLGGGGDAHAPRYAGAHGASGGATFGATRGYADPCQVPHAQAPLPRGCHPSQVSIGVPGGGHAGGFPQTPQFGAASGGYGQLATGGYGTHSGGNVHTRGLHGGSAPALRKPRFRGALDLGVEKSYRGDLLDYARAGNDPTDGYNAYRFLEGNTSGTTVDGDRVETIYTADNFSAGGIRGDRAGNLIAGPGFDVLPTYDERSVPNISISDAYSIPATIGLSGEYIIGKRASVFGRLGYSHSEGASGDVASVEGTVNRDTFTQTFDADGVAVGPVIPQSSYVPNVTLARWSYDFSDMERIDLEAGGRVYFNPVSGQDTGRTVTPFIGASAGASRYNAVSYTVDQSQLSYTSVYTENEPRYFDVDGNPNNPNPGNRVDLYDAQWVPSGRLAVGAEWQVTPKTAFALETGLRIEGARDYSNGAKGDTNVSVPVTLRGSFNF